MTHDPRTPSVGDAVSDGLPESLRASLRALRRDVAPPAYGWEAVAARIASASPAAAPHARPQVAAPRRRRRWAVPLALAASLAGVLALTGTWQRGVQPAPSDAVVQADARPDVPAHAEGLVREYRAALAQIDPAALPPALQPGLAELDRNAAHILAALQEAPDSALLLQQLRRTYARRLALAQRAALT